MKYRVLVLSLVLVAAGLGPARAMELRVVADTGAAAVEVVPGAVVAYRVEAELGADGGQGLALLRFDLELPSGVLSPVTVPAGSAMAAFAPPGGYAANPAGYGGLALGDRLLAVGGAQNVFAHGAWACDTDRDCPAAGTCSGGFCSPVAGLPTDPLVLGVALAGAPVVAAEGVAIVPTEPGTYQLAVSSALATVVTPGAGGDPVWRTAPVAAITGSALQIVVSEGTQPAAEIPTAGPFGLALLVLLLAVAGMFLLGRR